MPAKVRHNKSCAFAPELDACHTLFMASEMNRKDIAPFWCIAANIVEERFYGPSGTLSSRGTKHFPAGAKVHIINVYWGMAGESLTVVGRHRGSHRYVTMDLPTSCLTNLRIELVYSPHVISQITAHWWMYKADRKEPDENDNQWGGNEESRKIAEERCAQLKSVSERLQNEILNKRNQALKADETD